MNLRSGSSNIFQSFRSRSNSCQSARRSKQFNAVKAQLKRNDVKDIIIATDAGREGELVARWILEQAKVRKPVKRLWISSVTDKAIKDGFNNLKGWPCV